VGRDLEMQEQIGIEDGSQQQDGGERASDKRNKAKSNEDATTKKVNSYACLPHQNGHLFVRELSNVDIGRRIRLIHSTGEEVRQLVELPELPLCEEGVSSATNRRWIFVIFLIEVHLVCVLAHRV
jgi:hypothetical protein